MPGILKRIASFFHKPSAPAESPEQLKQEMDALQAQINAIDFLGRGDYEEAIALFTTAFACESLGRQRPYHLRAVCFRLTDHHPLAIKDYTKYLESHPDEWEAYSGRALSYLELDSFDSQRNDLQRVKVLLERKRKKTEEELESLANIDSDIEFATIRVDHHKELGRLADEVEDMLEQARKSNPHYSKHDPVFNVSRKIYNASYEKAIKKGLEFDKKREFDLALEYYDYAIELKTNDSRAYSCRAFCLQAMEYNLDAIEDFSEALILAPDDPNLHFGIGNCFFALKRYDVAVMHGDRAISWAEKRNSLYAAYDEWALEQGYKDAADAFKKVTMSWKIAREGLGDLKQISSSYPDVQEFLKKSHAEEDARTDKLLRRRPIN
jgi:tetratricopeptide (TPR) repeat protein